MKKEKIYMKDSEAETAEIAESVNGGTEMSETADSVKGETEETENGGGESGAAGASGKDSARSDGETEKAAAAGTIDSEKEAAERPTASADGGDAKASDTPMTDGWARLLSAYPGLANGEELPDRAIDLMERGATPLEAMQTVTVERLREEVTRLRFALAAERTNAVNLRTAAGSVRGTAGGNDEIAAILLG